MKTGVLDIKFAMNKINKFLLILLIGLGLAACKTKPFNSYSLVNDDDKLWSAAPDTFTLQTFVEIEDSLPSTGLGTNFLGSINNDPVYGTTIANMYMQVNLPQSQLSLGTSPVIDSMFITLSLAGIYGDTTGLQDITVQTIDASSSNKIQTDSVYQSNKTFAVGSTIIASKSNFSWPTDSQYYDGVKVKAYLKIPITDAAFISSFASQTSSGAFLDNAALHNYLNGFFIKSNSTVAKSLMAIDASAALTGLAVYYHNSTEDSLSLVFPINKTGTVNNYIHNYTGAMAQSAISSATQDSITYLQGIAGMRLRIKMPYIKNLKNVLINKAQLIFTDLDNSGSTTYPAAKALLIGKNVSNKAISIDDYGVSPFENSTASTYYGGTRSTTGTYTFNLALYLQRLIDNEIDNDGLFAKIIYASQTPNYVRLGGGNISTSSKKLKLKILFTPIK